MAFNSDHPSVQHDSEELGCQAIRSQLFAIEVDAKLGNQLLGFDDARCQPFNASNGGFDLLGFAAQHVQVVAIDLECDIS